MVNDQSAMRKEARKHGAINKRIFKQIISNLITNGKHAQSIISVKKGVWQRDLKQTHIYKLEKFNLNKLLNFWFLPQHIFKQKKLYKLSLF